jgi:hypothetical protein
MPHDPQGRADILRVPAVLCLLADDPALRSYSGRMLDRPACRKALLDQLDHFAAGDAARA